MDRPDTTAAREKLLPAAAAGTVVAIVLLWAWWPSLRDMVSRWSGDPRYSHGFLVPMFAAYLLWSRRAMLAASRPSPSLWGLAFIAFGALLGLAGARFYLGWFESLAPLASLAGLALLAGGWPALRWSAPSIGFLAFMIPLPYRLETALGYPLQRAATIASTYALQTLGLPAVAEGNIILIDDARIGVVEACNGLGMLLMFFAFATAIVLISRFSLVDRIVILLSAAPIAFLANVTRITLTGFLHHVVGGKVANTFYHDLAGWLMMPLALIAFGLELKILSHLFIEPPRRDDRLAIGMVPGLGFAASRPAATSPPSGGRR